MRAIVACLFALAACNACSGGKVQIKQAAVVQWDGGTDDAAHACAILNAVWTASAGASCPDGQNEALCASTLRNDRAQGAGSMFDPACIVAAGPNVAALQACGACQ